MSTLPIDAATAAVWGYKPTAPQARILSWRVYRNSAGTMAGFFAVEVPSGLVIRDCKLMVGPKGTHFIGLPSIQRRDRDGQPARDENGKPVWDPIVEFRDRATRDRFTAMALEALRRAHPEAFETSPP